MLHNSKVSSLQSPGAWNFFPLLQKGRDLQRGIAKGKTYGVCAFADAGPQQVGTVGSVTRAGCTVSCLLATFEINRKVARLQYLGERALGPA